MKKILWAIILLLVTTSCYSADVTIDTLSSEATPTGDDILYIMNDPTGTAGDRKVTITNLFGNIPSNVVGTDELDLSISPAWTGDHNFGGGTLEAPNSTSLPGTCTVGEIYIDTNATAGSNTYACLTTDNWTLQAGGGGGGSTITFYTVGTLPGGPSAEDLAGVTDGNDASDCVVGGGSNYNVCVYNGAAWVPVGDGTGGSGSLGTNLSSTTNDILSDTGTLSFGDDHLVTTGTITAAEVRITGTGVASIDKMSITGSLTIPYSANPGVQTNGNIAISTGNIDLGPTIKYWAGQDMWTLAIRGSEVIPINNHGLLYDSAKKAWTMGALAVALFTQNVDEIVFNDTDYSLGIGGVDLATSDIVLQGTGQAVFNEQGANVDFRVESDTNDQALFVEGSNGYVGVNQNAPSEQFTVNGTLLVEGNNAAHIDFSVVTTDPCSSAGSSEAGVGSLFYSNAGYFCYCDNSGVDKKIVDDGTCGY